MKNMYLQENIYETPKKRTKSLRSKFFPTRGYHPEPLTPAFEAEVLEALERLGEEANQSEPRAIPPVGGTDRDRRESSVGVASFPGLGDGVSGGFSSGILLFLRGF